MQRLILLFSFLLLLNCINKQSFANNIEYQEAAAYTHLQWQQTQAPSIALTILPIKNLSGVPIEDRDERPEYYYYGKLPAVLDTIASKVWQSSKRFNLTTEQADYQLQLSIDSYQLPFPYAPDDYWWQKLHDQADRWLQSPPPALLKLSLSIIGINQKIHPWKTSITVRLSQCDINASVQPSVADQSDSVLSRYLSTSPGQAFLAALNYLQVKTIERLGMQPYDARISAIFNNEIHLISQVAGFTSGESLDLFYHSKSTGKSASSAGQVKVIKVLGQQAIAYPQTLRSDHLKVGDWVELKRSENQKEQQKNNKFANATSFFVAASECAAVADAE